MARRKQAPKKEITPDPRYNSTVVTKFITRMMVDGKKSVSTGIVYGAFEEIKKKGHENPLEVFLKGLNNYKTSVEVKSRRV